MKNTFDRLSDKNSINYLITYSNYNYITDKGLFFTDFQSQSVPVIGELKTSYNFGESNSIMFIQIQCNYFENISIRSYAKLQDLFTKIGGVIKTFVLMGIIVNYLYSHSFTTIDNVFLNHKFKSSLTLGFQVESKNIEKIFISHKIVYSQGKN